VSEIGWFKSALKLAKVKHLLPASKQNSFFPDIDKALENIAQAQMD